MLNRLKNRPEWGIALAFLLGTLLLRWISGFNGLYGQDAHEYLRESRALHAFFLGGPKPGAFFWPLNYPITGSLLAFLVGTGSLCLQLVSLLALPGSYLYLCGLLRKQFPQSASPAIYLALVFLAAPYLMRGTFLVMSDMMGLFLICAVLFHAFRYQESGRSRDLAGTALAVSLAVFTRYPAAILLAPFVLWMGVLAFRYRDYKGSLVAISLVLLSVLPNYFLRSEMPLHFLENGLFQQASPLHLFQRSYEGPDGFFSYPLPNGIYLWLNLFHPGFLVLGLPLLAFFRKPDLKSAFAKLLLLSWGIYCLFIGCIPLQNSRFLLISFPFVVILLFPAFLRMQNGLSQKMRFGKWLIYGLIPLQLALFAYSARPHYRLYQLESQISQNLIEEHPGPTLYTFALNGALSTYEVQNSLVNLWDAPLTSVDTGSLVLFNEGQFTEQWKGKNPMINWEFLNTNYQLFPLESYPEGWMLYELQ